jgi:hypothetical protein
MSLLLICQLISCFLFGLSVLAFRRGGLGVCESCIAASPFFIAPVLTLAGSATSLYLIDILGFFLVVSAPVLLKRCASHTLAAVMLLVLGAGVLPFLCIVAAGERASAIFAAMNVYRVLVVGLIVVYLSKRPREPSTAFWLAIPGALCLLTLCVLMGLQSLGILDTDLYGAYITSNFNFSDAAYSKMGTNVLGLFRFSEGALLCYCSVFWFAVGGSQSRSHWIWTVAVLGAGITGIVRSGSETSAIAVFVATVCLGIVRKEMKLLLIAAVMASVLVAMYATPQVFGGFGWVEPLVYKAQRAADVGFGFNRADTFGDGIRLIQEQPGVLFCQTSEIEQFQTESGLQVLYVGSFHCEYLDIVIKGGLLALLLYLLGIALLSATIGLRNLSSNSGTGCYQVLLLCGLLHGVTGCFLQPASLFVAPCGLLAVAFGLGLRKDAAQGLPATVRAVRKVCNFHVEQAVL